MKLTKSQLQKIIKEELEAVMNENRVTVDRDYEAERQTSIDTKQRAGVERRKKEKEDEDQRRGSYYRHQPPDRAESYPGEFRARYMEEGAEGADLFKIVRDEGLVMGNVDRDAFFKWLRAGDLTTADAVKANRGMIAGWLKKNR